VTGVSGLAAYVILWTELSATAEPSALETALVEHRPPPGHDVQPLFTDPSKNTIYPFDPHDVSFVYGSLWK
jgi:hypothetical protein